MLCSYFHNNESDISKMVQVIYPVYRIQLDMHQEIKNNRNRKNNVIS